MESVESQDYSYNKNLFVRESHNCYTYFLNLKSDKAYFLCKEKYKKERFCRRPQPGYASKMPLLKKKDFNCPTMMKRTLKDNKHIFQTTKREVCPSNYYKGALVVAPERDYHYYRLNDDGIWTHKPGYKPSTHLDNDQKPIYDPELANRDSGGTLNYKDFCGYLCVPRTRKKKTMQMYRD